MLKKEQCPDNLIDMKQPSVFETKNYPTDKSDGIDDSDESVNFTPSIDTKRPNYYPDDKKPLNKKDHRGYPNDRDRQKKKNPRRPGSNNKLDPYDPNSSSSQPDQSTETDNESSSSPFSSTMKHHSTKQSKKPHPSGMGPNGLSQHGPNKSGQSKETDDLDYPDESSPLTSQSNKGHRPTNQHLDKSQIESGGSPNNLKRPGRSPDRAGVSNLYNPDDGDVTMPLKRPPRRGDIGIQTLDERGECDVNGR